MIKYRANEYEKENHAVREINVSVFGIPVYTSIVKSTDHKAVEQLREQKHKCQTVIKGFK